MTVTLFEVVPPAPAHERVYIVFVVGETLIEPLDAGVIGVPLIVHVTTFEQFQESVACWGGTMTEGLPVKVHEGGGPPLLHRESEGIVAEQAPLQV